MSNQVFHFSNTGISAGQRFYLKDDVSGIFLRNLVIDSNFPISGSNLVYSGEVVPVSVNINNITGNFIFNSSFNSKLLTINASQNITGTVSTGLVTGYNVSFVQIDSGQLFITGSNGAIIRQRLNLYNTAGQYSIASLLHHSGNQFILYGDLV